MIVPRMIIKFMYQHQEYTIPLTDVDTAIRAVVFLNNAGWGNAEIIDLLDDSNTGLVTFDSSVIDRSTDNDWFNNICEDIRSRAELFVDIEQTAEKVNFFGRFDSFSE